MRKTRLKLGKFWKERLDAGQEVPSSVKELGYNHPHIVEYMASVDKEAETGGDVDYSSMSKGELREEAKKLGLDDSKAKTKDDLVVLLETESDKAKEA